MKLMVIMLVAGILVVPANGRQMQTPTPPVSGFRADFLRGWDDLEKKVVSLAEATPQEKYGWRPGQGVRSTGEVFAHVAAGNYGYMRWLGVQPPSDIDMKTIEQITNKEKIIELLKRSFDHVRQAVVKVPDSDLEKPVKMMNREGTVREAIFFVATHQPEHLGQAIAYARINNIVPPWTAERQAQQEQKK
ncbi:MAG: DinB family protein [Ignavibacteriales bacterium]|nr:DinB family protein [Ignavibacteriales bacterium]